MRKAQHIPGKVKNIPMPHELGVTHILSFVRDKLLVFYSHLLNHLYLADG
jgi:hypothetical protein